MAIKLENKVNTEAPSVAYPFGNIKDNTGSNNGTPVDKNVYADFHQFFAKMMAESGIAYNDLPDNETDGFQYFLALIKVVTDNVNIMGADSLVKLKRKIIDIGEWKMEDNASKSVAHGIADHSKIRSVEVYIRNNTGSNIIPLNTAYDGSVGSVQGSIGIVDSTNVYLYRLNLGLFQANSFNSSSYNRGWIHIIYEV